jgi:hypothetical protein
MSKKNSNETIGNRTRHLPACKHRVSSSITCAVFITRYPASPCCFFFSFLALWIIITAFFNLLSSPTPLRPTWPSLACSNLSLYMQVYTDLTFTTFLRILLFEVACIIQVLRSSLCYPLISNSNIVSTIS